MFKNMRIHVGKRIIKSAVAAGLSMLITQALHMDFPSLAVAAAILVMQPTFHETLEMSWRRIWGTIIGSFLALIVVYFLPVDATIAVTIGVFIIISISSSVSMANAGILGVIAYVSIVTFPGSTYLTALNRVANTVVGVSASIMLNFFFPVAPIEQRSNAIIDKLLRLDIKLLSENLRLIISERTLDQDGIEKLKNEILKALNDAYAARALIKKEENYLNHGDEFEKYDEKYDAIWNIHNAVILMYGEYQMFFNKTFGITEEFAVCNREIISFFENIEINDGQFPKGTIDKLMELIDKMENLITNDFKEMYFATVQEEMSFFTLLIADLKLIAGNIKYFELR